MESGPCCGAQSNGQACDGKTCSQQAEHFMAAPADVQSLVWALMVSSHSAGGPFWQAALARHIFMSSEPHHSPGGT